MKPSYKNVLTILAEDGGWVSGRALPDGNGRRGCARLHVLVSMRKDGLIISDPSDEAYRITHHGLTRLALAGG